LQRVIEMQPDDHTQLCLIGHNPGLSDFVLEALPAGSQRDAYRGLTTAAWASWAFTAASWRAFAPDASYTIAQSISPDNARAI
jgi:phosphohistidine phosphatase SixA